jgi:hypothetical protein
MDKWIGWVTDSEGYVVHFVSPTSKGSAERKTKAVIIDNHGERWWSNLGYALRTTLNGRSIEERWFSKLSDVDKQSLHKLLEMGLGI